jgi:DNA-binding PucR family transcriptional regulator
MGRRTNRTLSFVRLPYTAAVAEPRSETPPRAVQDVLRKVAADLLDHLDELAAAASEAILASDPRLAEDPAVATELRASSRANAQRFLTALAKRPGERPPPDVPPEALDLARTLVRRDIRLDALAHAYRRGQNASWRAWLDACARHASRDVLPQVVAVSAELVFGFVDDVLTQLIANVERERDELTGGASARREHTVRLLLDGAPVDAEAAGRRLGHRLDRFNTALIVWTEHDQAPQGAAEELAHALARAAAQRQALTVSPSSTTLWAWISSDGPVEDAELGPATSAAPDGLRVALGTSRPGPAGFRRSHEEALAAQRLVVGHATPERLIAYRHVEVIALLGHDEQRLRRFVGDTLGALAADDPATARLRHTLRVYLREGDNAARAAERLNTHRNTVLHRIARAEATLGHPVGQRRLALAVALEASAQLGLLPN